ncbi:MAG: phosphoglucosamine mutase, partial [Acidobacteriota bacterium]|nr:phosphoglucosamine mutase [Acidobacteriota bacterium]
MTGSRLFGTDGIRGPFGVPPLDADSVRRLGLALGSQLAREELAPSVLVAGDTRSSTPDLCRWLAEGLTLRGTRIVYGGVLPTPAVARLVPQLGCRVGIAVSASHNPFPDNGIKIVDHHGFKWPPARERELERQLEALSTASFPTVDLTPDPTLAEAYLANLTTVLEAERRLDGLRVTLDTANGAATGLAAKLFRRLGAEVNTLGDTPDGRNINAGFGSTRPKAMAAATAGSSSQLGFAFDGDADRVLLADEVGTVHSGDAILYLLAVWMRKRGRLEPPRLVATTMSNLGLEIALAEHDIEVLRCGVGDRVVVRTLQREGLILGGEQSGHVVHLGLGPTGDGLLTALLVSLA